MSIPKISGQQARELLGIWAGDVEGLTFAQLGADRSYGDLFGAAPALAETVAWLYGRRANVSRDIHSVYHHNNEDCDVVYAVKGGTIIFDVDGGHRSIEEAEEFARAILAVVEEARS